MTDQLRAAAQALLEVCNGYGCTLETEIEARKDALRAALSAPQPAADERVAQLMRLVQAIADEAHANGNGYGEGYWLTKQLSAIESSARALLAAGREDAPLTEERIMHLWGTRVGEMCAKYPLTRAEILSFARAVISATQKGTP